MTTAQHCVLRIREWPRYLVATPPSSRPCSCRREFGLPRIALHTDTHRPRFPRQPQEEEEENEYISDAARRQELVQTDDA